MKHINLDTVQLIYEEDYSFHSMSFADKASTNGWFITFARISGEVYYGHMGLDFDLENFSGDILVLAHDSYLLEFDLMLIENEDTITCMFKTRDDETFELICKLNSSEFPKLDIVEMGEWEGSSIDLAQKSFNSVNKLIERIDGYFFYEYFEGC